jgi:S-adenosylmethionine hydrolase
MTILTLLTDFGTEDEYVGVMKGIILSIAPDVRLVDLSHQVPPQDIRRAAFLLMNAVPYFPPDTVHLAVVDPGVGTARRPVAVRTPAGTFVGPDNGLFSWVLERVPEWTAVEIREPAYQLPLASSTFQGRDIFAPVAAHLAAGVPLEKLGPRVEDPVWLPPPRLEISDFVAEGEVLYADRFGNLVTSIGYLVRSEDTLALKSAFGPQAVLPVFSCWGRRCRGGERQTAGYPADLRRGGGGGTAGPGGEQRVSGDRGPSGERGGGPGRRPRHPGDPRFQAKSGIGRG